jgi:hypothetical protein
MNIARGRNIEHQEFKFELADPRCYPDRKVDKADIQFTQIGRDEPHTYQ